MSSESPQPFASAERRLHPLTLLFEIGRGLRQLAVPMVVLFFVSRSRDGGQRLIAPTVVLGVSAVVAVTRYLSFRYRYGRTELVVRSGIFVRNERHIPYDRIQSIDAEQSLAHRLLNVVTVQVQTGASTAPEATLSVLPASALAEMRARVFGARAQPADAMAAMAASTAAAMDTGPATDSALGARSAAPSAAGGDTLLHVAPRELAISGFIENRGMVLVLGALGLIWQLDPLQERIVARIADWVPGLLRTNLPAASVLSDTRALLPALSAGLALVLAVLLAVRLLSTVWAAVRLHDFRLTRAGDDLRVEYGLLTRVATTIPVRRIQTIVVHETLLHRWLGRAAVRVATAGGGVGTEGRAEREWVAPIIARAAVPAFLDALQPGLALESAEWRRAHPRATRRLALRSAAVAVVIAGVAAYVVGWWALAVLLVLLAWAVVRAAVYTRHLGWAALRDGVAFRAGWLRRNTTIARFSRVQAVRLDESPFDRRAAMADVGVDTAAAGLVMPYLARADAVELRDLVVARAAASAFTW